MKSLMKSERMRKDNGNLLRHSMSAVVVGGDSAVIDRRYKRGGKGRFGE